MKSGKSGKCSNFGNCALADAHTVIEIPNGMDFVCTECGKPLLLSGASSADAAAGSGNNQTVRMAALAAVVVALLGGGAWFVLRGDKNTTPPPPPVVTVPSTTPESAPMTGNCSDADAQAGLCRKK
ncbi:MAG: hypothetical protein RIR79_1000 [Pseudomonadota bacterium]